MDFRKRGPVGNRLFLQVAIVRYGAGPDKPGFIGQ